MKIAICDDEKAQLELIQSYCRQWADRTKAKVSFQAFESAESFLFHHEDNKDYDVLLLDIEMGKLNGMELAKKLRTIGEDVKIAFITGNPEYVFEGYSVAALDYILKPIKEEKLYQVLDKVYQSKAHQTKCIMIQSGGSIHKVNILEVCAIESSKHDAFLHMENESLLAKKSITEMEQEVDGGGFYRCHRSYLVNLSKVVTISKKEVVLEGGHVIPIARGKWEGLNKAYLDFYRGVLCT